MDKDEGMACCSTSNPEEKSKVEQIVSEFFAKSLHVILKSRIPHISVENDPDASHLSSASPPTALQQTSRSNLWFHLDLSNCPAVVRNVEPWRRRIVEPMVVDIVLQQSGEEGGAVSTGHSGTLLERWVVQYIHRRKGCVCRSSGGGGGGSKNRVFKGTGEAESLPRCYPTHVVERPVVYKKMVIMLRSLYCTMRLLPAHRLFRLVNSSCRGQSFTLSYRVSAASFPVTHVDETAMMTCRFTPVETTWGQICVSVNYRRTTAVTALEITPPILPTIIPDYVGSPTTNPLRRFSSVGATDGRALRKKAIDVVSLPGSMPSSPAGPSFARRHSWSGHQNFLRALASPPAFQATQLRSPQPPDFYRSPVVQPGPCLSCSVNDPLSQSLQRSGSYSGLPVPHSPRTAALHHNQGGCSNLPITTYESGKASSRSPSQSPSPPVPFNDVSQSPFHGPQSAPVCIPGRSSAWHRPDKTNHHPSLPDGRSRLQPRSQGHPPTPSWNADDSPGLVGAKSRPRTGHSISNVDGRYPQRPHSNHQAGEMRLDGPLSAVERSFYGLPSRTTSGSISSKRPSMDEDGKEEFSYPFAVDGDEGENQGSRVERPSLNLTANEFEHTQKRSQDAAVGALVRILKYAPALRHENLGIPLDVRLSFLPPTSPTSKRNHVASIRGGKENHAPLPPVRRHLGSTFSDTLHTSEGAGRTLSPKSFAFAWKEFRAYLEMRDHLLRQSGAKIRCSSPTKNVGWEGH